MLEGGKLPSIFIGEIMDIKIINEMIEELEDSDTTYTNVEDLASLYIVREKLNVSTDNVVKELNDILPAYNVYKTVKRNYQLNGIDKLKVLRQLESVCRELKDFICRLYSNSDSPEEREIIFKTIKALDCEF